MGARSLIGPRWVISSFSHGLKITGLPPHAQVELAALFLVAKKKLSDEAKKDSILCKKTWGIQP